MVPWPHKDLFKLFTKMLAIVQEGISERMYVNEHIALQKKFPLKNIKRLILMYGQVTGESDNDLQLFVCKPICAVQYSTIYCAYVFFFLRLVFLLDFYNSEFFSDNYTVYWCDRDLFRTEKWGGGGIVVKKKLSWVIIWCWRFLDNFKTSKR